MCGIVGITSFKLVAQRLLGALEALEYRGYDSAGIALQTSSGLKRLRASGKLGNLRALYGHNRFDGTCGIGHTRWATHGSPCERNAHPQGTSRVMGVHNGIVENFLPLKESLLKEGVVFESDTDTEVMMHLLDQAVGKYLTSTPPDALTPSDLPGLLLPVFKSLEGSFACALLFAPFPHVVVCYRQGTSPLVVGYGEGETFFGSDALSLAGLSDSLVYLEDGDTAVLTPEGVRLWDRYGAPVQRSPVPNPIASGPVTKEGYPHFMAKEIHQQPLMLTHILDQYVSVAEAGARSGASVTFNPALSVQRPAALRLVGCGTAYYAGLVAASWFERYARLSPHVEIASEFRYRRPPLDRGGAIILISQSGETIDTLGALAYGQEAVQELCAVVNVPGSSLARAAQHVFYTHGGPEIGVASTKGFTSQLMVLGLLSLSMGHNSGMVTQGVLAASVEALYQVPLLVEQVLEGSDGILEAARSLVDAHSALYLGRGTMAALAAEGALKLKELSYIHAEGYAAGEMKHGPIALLDGHVPVVALVPSDGLVDKMASNLQEASARGAPLLILTDAPGKERLSGLRDVTFIILPSTSFLTAPFVYAAALQLLAYHVSCLKGNDVDQPRNLAKSVTVE